MRGTCLPLSPAGSWELRKSEEKKTGGGLGGGTGSCWPNAEICIIVTKYISKLWIKYKLQITRHVFNYVFQILVFQLLDNSANKHAEQPRFFSCFTSGPCTLAKYKKLCMVWQRNIRNMLWAFWGLCPPPKLSTMALPLDPAGRLPSPYHLCPLPPNPGYATDRTSPNFGWFSFPGPLRVGSWVVLGGWTSLLRYSLLIASKNHSRTTPGWRWVTAKYHSLFFIITGNC